MNYYHNGRTVVRARLGDKCQECPYFSEECVTRNDRVPETHVKQHSICWCCANACDGNKCEYIRTGIPYEDSTYKTRTLKDGTVCINVRTCPYFERG